MTRELQVSSKIVSDILKVNIADELNAQSIETVCKRMNVNYDTDDMYNIIMYAKDENLCDQYVWYTLAEEINGKWESVPR